MSRTFKDNRASRLSRKEEDGNTKGRKPYKRSTSHRLTEVRKQWRAI